MINEFEHEYIGYGLYPSKCSVRVISTDLEHVIYFGDLSQGTSVTNASEQLAAEIVNMLKLEPEDCRFFETYDYQEFDEITYTWEQRRNKWVAHYPEWKPADSCFVQLFSK